MKKLIGLLLLLILSVTINALPSAETDGTAAVKAWASAFVASGEADFASTGQTRYPSPGFWGGESVYQIQVDRFNNGDTSNDKNNLPSFQVSTNGVDLYGLPDYRNGGDIRGIIQRLDYLKDLGVTAIWTTPLIMHDGAYHGYNPIDFTKIDPGFGTNEEFRELVKEAHKRGIKVILDIVVNHMGDKNTYYSKAANHYLAADELNAKDWAGTSGGSQYQGTLSFGSTFFPPLKSQYFFNRVGANSTADMQGTGSASIFGDFVNVMLDFDTRNYDFQEIFTTMHKYWIAYADVDGFRLDAVKHVTADFLAYFSTETRDYAKKLGKDNFYIVGEVAGPSDWIAMRVGKMMSDPVNPANHGVIPAGLTNRILTVKDKYLANPKAPYPGMTAAYDFAFSGTSRDVLLNVRNANEVENYFKGDYYSMIAAQNDARLNFNVLEIHDWPRFIQDGTNKNNPWKSQLAVSYLPLARGIPITYYGMEQGFNGMGHTDNVHAGAANNDVISTMNGGGADSLKRQDMFISGQWRLGSSVAEIDALNYVGVSKPSVWFDWTTDPFLNRTNQVYKAARKMNWIRQSSNALKYGTTTFRWGDVATSGILAFSRIDASEEVVVIVNTASSPITIPNFRVDNTVNPTSGAKYVNLLNGAQVAYTGKSGVDSYLYFNGMKIDGNSVMVFTNEANLSAWNSYLECYLIKDNPVGPPAIDTSKIYKWSGNVESYPENGKVSSTDDVWVNIETSALGGIAGVNVLYSTDSGTTWTTKALELGATAKNGNDWWHISIGKFPINTNIKYKFQITDKVGTVAVNDNKGEYYTAYVSTAGIISYLGTTTNSPLDGSVNVTDDLWINTVTKPIGASIVVKAAYTVNHGPTTYVTMATNGTTTDGGQKWNVNIGKQPAGALITYWIEVYNVGGTTALATDYGTSGIGYTVTINTSNLPLTWIGSISNTPANGSIKSTDNLIVNAQTSAIGSAAKVDVKYTLKGVSATKTMTRNGVSGTNELWTVNLGKFASESLIDYEVTAYDATGAAISTGLIYSVSVNKDAFTSVYTTMYFRGTPNGWATTSPMALIANNTWSIKAVKTGTTTTERFKFDVKGDWTINFGLNGTLAGTDIPLAANSTYDITFNDSTKVYTLTKVTYPTTLTIAASASSIKSSDTTFALPSGTYTTNGASSTVALTWSPTLDRTKVGTTIYTGSYSGLSVTYELTVVEESLKTATTSSSINQGDTTFALPATGTYTDSGSSNTVVLAWTPALDVTKVGTTTYTAVYGAVSATYKLTVIAVLPPTLTLATTSATVNKRDAVFTLPVAGTYTANNASSTVNVTWTPTLDTTIVGNTLYTATYNGVSATFTLTVLALPTTLTITPTSASIKQGAAYTLPTTGTYTTDGTASTVDVVWSPELNTSTVGDTTYTATYNSTTAAFKLTVTPVIPPTLTIATTKSTVTKGTTFTLPATGTYSQDGVSSTVALTWSPAVDTTIVGDTVYTATYNGLSVTYTLTVNAVALKSTYTTMYYRGTSNAWAASPMTLTADYTWSINGVKTGTTTTERFKFDVKGDWTINFGLNGGTGDIPLAANSTYNITFNDSTKAYVLTKVTSTLTIATSSSTVGKDAAFTLPSTGTYTNGGVATTVTLTWSATPDTSTAGVKTYTGTYAGLSVTYTLTVTAPTLTIATSSSTVGKDAAFTLPSTGTYTNGGVAAIVTLTWSATPDTSTVGVKTYTGTYAGLSVTYTLTVTTPTLTIATNASSVAKGTAFSLPTTGTYTNGGVATTVTLIWSATPDTTTVGVKTYTGTYAGLSVTYTLTVTAVAYKSTYTTMKYRGTSNAWVATSMTLTADYTWSITNVVTGATTTERFKFDVKGDWTINFGDTNKDNTAELSGGDIPLAASSTYDITFNDSTKKITITKK